MLPKEELVICGNINIAGVCSAIAIRISIAGVTTDKT